MLFSFQYTVPGRVRVSRDLGIPDKGVVGCCTRSSTVPGRVRVSRDLGILGYLTRGLQGAELIPVLSQEGSEYLWISGYSDNESLVTNVAITTICTMYILRMTRHLNM